MKTCRKISLCLGVLFIPLFAIYAQIEKLKIGEELDVMPKQLMSIPVAVQKAANQKTAEMLGWKIDPDELKVLSLRKPITSISTLQPNSKMEYLVDGIQIPDATTYRWFTTQNYPSFVIDLQRVCRIYQFVTYDCQTLEPTLYNVPAYNIYVGLEDALSNNWKKVLGVGGRGAEKIKTDMIEPVEARYIRYEVAGTVSGGIRMYEFEVWGEEIKKQETTDVTMQSAMKDLQLISYDKPVIPDITKMEADSLPRLGKDFSGWKATKTSPSFIVDLGKVYDVSRFQLLFGDGVPNYTISTCEDNTDGFQWKLAGKNTDRTWYLSRTMVIQPQKARYVKFETDAADAVITQVNDFEVWGWDSKAVVPRQFFTMNWVWVVVGVLTAALLIFLLFMFLRRSDFRF